MSNNKNDLVPCDRCGKTNVDFYTQFVDEDECYFRFLHYCNAINGHIDSGWFDTKQEVVDAWNYKYIRGKLNE